MNIQELLGEAYKEGMSIDEINNALDGKSFIDSSVLPPSVSKSVYDKTASELAKAKNKIAELENASLSDDEKLKNALKEAQEKQEEYIRKSIRLDVEKVLVTGGLTENDYKGIIDGLITSDSQASIAMAESLVKVISDQKQAAANAIKKELQGSLGELPKGSGANGITKEDFSKMTLTEKIRFKEENPEQYENFRR